MMSEKFEKFLEHRGCVVIDLGYEKDFQIRYPTKTKLDLILSIEGKNDQELLDSLKKHAKKFDQESYIKEQLKFQDALPLNELIDIANNIKSGLFDLVDDTDKLLNGKSIEEIDKERKEFNKHLEGYEETRKYWGGYIDDLISCGLPNKLADVDKDELIDRLLDSDEFWGHIEEDIQTMAEDLFEEKQRDMEEEEEL